MNLRPVSFDVSTQTHRYNKSITRFPHLMNHNFDISSNINFKYNLTSISGVLPRIKTEKTNLLVDFRNYLIRIIKNSRITNIMKMRPVRCEEFHADMTNLEVVLRI